MLISISIPKLNIVNFVSCDTFIVLLNTTQYSVSNLQNV